jgi:hypothetical protein
VALKDNLRSRSPREVRNEREELGFVRQPEVRWLTPSLLLKTGIEVAVSGTFGKFADKREIQRDEQDQFDYSAAGELWIDYISDTGDGFDATYTIAWLLAQEQLQAGGQALPRGRILLQGGDQVYPTADPEAYEDRFTGPFGAALPHVEPSAAPDMYVLPGNHDWYDGLVSFLRVFCAERKIGGWRTRQRRSYFALKLPNDWWIWAIDIQLDTYIDNVQLTYFEQQPIAPGDKVLLLTAKPAWTKAYRGRVEPASWRYLSFFEERYVRARGARLVLTLTGDTHHYARYEPSGDGADDAPTRITAGGGGAYLSATHTLKPQLRLLALDGSKPVTYTREEIYPSAEVSRKLGNGILKLPLLNPGFAGLFGVVYALLALAMLSALNVAAGDLVDSATAGGLFGMLAGAAGGMSIMLALLVLVVAFGSAEILPDPLERSGAVRKATSAARLLTALVHAAAHVALAALVVWLALKLAPQISGAAIAVWLLAVLLAFAVGAGLGTTIWGLFMWLVHTVRGSKAPRHANDVFSGQSIADYKNLVRMHLRPDGGLTIYPLGVDRVGREWTYEGRRDDGPWFMPRGAPPAIRAIDRPLEFDRTGARVV